LVQIIRGLLAEEISIRNLSSILDSLLCFQSTDYVDISKIIVFLISGGTIISKTSNLDEIKVNQNIKYDIPYYVSVIQPLKNPL